MSFTIPKDERQREKRPYVSLDGDFLSSSLILSWHCFYLFVCRPTNRAILFGPRKTSWRRVTLWSEVEDYLFSLYKGHSTTTLGTTSQQEFTHAHLLLSIFCISLWVFFFFLTSIRIVCANLMRLKSKPFKRLFIVLDWYNNM